MAEGVSTTVIWFLVATAYGVPTSLIDNREYVTKEACIVNGEEETRKMLDSTCVDVVGKGTYYVINGQIPLAGPELKVKCVTTNNNKPPDTKTTEARVAALQIVAAGSVRKAGKRLIEVCRKRLKLDQKQVSVTD